MAHFGNSAHQGGASYRRLVLACALLMLFAMGSAGCRDNSSSSSNTPIEPTADHPLAGGTVVVAIPGDPGALNPLIYNSALAGMVYAEMHDGLTEMDVNLDWVPRIASHWDIADDGLSVTYFLKPWVWSDGAPLTAYDVASSFALFKDPRVASPRRGFYRDVLDAVALDSSTVRYDLARPVADPIQRTWHHILPYHITKDLDPARVPRWPLNDHPLSSGEFMLSSHDHNGDLVLVRNPRYPGVAAWLERVVFRVIPEPSARVFALESGAVDLVDHITSTEARRLENGGRVHVVAVNGRRFYYLQWNLENPIFHDPATRRALSFAVNRKGMIATLLKGYGTPAASPISPAVWNHDFQLEPDAYDPERSRRMLAAAGWRDTDGDGILERDGLELEFEILSKQGDPVRENGGLILKSDLAEVGATVKLLNLELATGLARLKSGNFDAYFGLMNANLYGDPSGYIDSQATDQFNMGHYANAKVDSLLETALGMMDRAQSLPCWVSLQETLAMDPPSAYLFYPDNLIGVSDRVRDVRPHLLSPINNMAQWWIDTPDRKYRSGASK